MVALYNSANGEYWIDNANWLSDRPIGSWHGVTTNGNGRVTALELDDNQLQGPIPAELGDLSFLQILNLEGNLLSGSIPGELGNLRRLRYLNFGENLLNGPIPEGALALPALETLILHENRLSGSIPDVIGDLSGLRYMNLFSNEFSGSIPAELGDLGSLKFLALSWNQLSGPIPDSIGGLQRLGTLYLDRNRLSGSIPDSIGGLQRLGILFLDSNRLTGPIPDSIGNLVRLRELRLHRNLLTGSIPAELGNLSTLDMLALNHNNLTGPIPRRLGVLDRLEWLYLSGNRLTGCIPAGWVNLRGNDLTALRLGRCPFGLPDLAVSPGAPYPPFQSEHRDYFLGVRENVRSVSLLPHAGSATVAVLDTHGQVVPDADDRRPGHQVVINDQETTIKIRVTSADGSEEISYNLRIRRGFPAAITVVDNEYVQAPGNEKLKHNIPDLDVVIGNRTLRADFLSHYRRTGELERWGYPTSEVLLLEPNTLTQFYQRGVLDFHDVGSGWIVERRLVWDYVGGGQGGSDDLGIEEGITNPHPGTPSGPWGHKVSNFAIDGTRVGFADFYEKLGGIAAFGLAKTDARIDTHGAGTLHIADATPGFYRQYFQAAVLEYHPYDAERPVKLSLLGNTLRDLLVKSWQEERGFAAAVPLAAEQAYFPSDVAPVGLEFTWFVDPPDSRHLEASKAIADVLRGDSALSPVISGFPWLADGVDDDELVVLGKLRSAQLADPDTARRVADFLANTGVITPTRRLRMTQFVDALVVKNPAAGRAVAGSPWFADGLNFLEAEFISELAEFSSVNLQIAESIARSPGIIDGIAWRDLESTRLLRRLAGSDRTSARIVAGLPWARDGFGGYELSALDTLVQIAWHYPGFVRQILGLAWVADDIDYWEQNTLNSLHGFRFNTPNLASELIGQLNGSRIDSEFAGALSFLENSPRADFSELSAQDWFRDGFDATDRAFVTALEYAARVSPNLYTEFAGTRYVQSAKMSRPQYGEIDIWVFQNGPFDDQENFVVPIESAIGFAERTLQLPFPFENLILLSLVPGTEVAYDLPPNVGFGRQLLLDRTGSMDEDLRAIYAGVADQFIGFGPLWLREGQSRMMASLIRAEDGVESLRDRKRALAELTREHCTARGTRFVSQLSSLARGANETPPCVKHLSESFLLNLLDVMGAEAMGAALKSLIIQIREPGNTTFFDRDLHDEFRAHTPDSRASAFRRVFEMMYGTAWAESRPGRRDDHGGNQAAATPIAVGSAIHARIAPGDDVDYFRFRAEKGVRYSLRATHGTLSSLRFAVVAGGQGETLLWTNSQGVHLGAHTFWVAPETDDYFVVVDTPDLKSGSYSLSIELADARRDDHSDEADFATTVTLGKRAGGTIERQTDVDAFRFSAEAGQGYRIRLYEVWDSIADIELFATDGITKIESLCPAPFVGNGEIIHWVAPATGEYFVAVYLWSGDFGDYADYELEVTPAAVCGAD